MTTTMSPRATPKIAPRMRSMNPRPIARTTLARLRARIAPATITATRISTKAIACLATGATLSQLNRLDTDPAYAIAAMKPTTHAASAIISRMIPRTKANSADSRTTATIARSNPFIGGAFVRGANVPLRQQASLRRGDDPAVAFALQRDARRLRFRPRDVAADAHP